MIVLACERTEIQGLNARFSALSEANMTCSHVFSAVQ